MKSFIVFLSFLIVSQLAQAQLPAAFDLRDVNGVSYVSTIKSQQGGTCWTHGALAAMESNLMFTQNWTIAGDTGEPALAEYHLDWWNGFNDHYNSDNTPVTGSGLSVHNGGDYRVTAAYVGRGDGAVREIDAFQTFNSPPLFTDSTYRYYYAPHIEWLKMGDKLVNIDNVKHTLVNYGAIGTCMAVGAFWGPNNTHYQPTSDNSDPNHAIAIIGWNDTLSTDADEAGAWLCKNSWGTTWGDFGYFWISYYDKHCGQHPEMGLISFRDVEVMKYDNVYYHDYHGWRDTLTQVSEAFNHFQTDEQQALKAVSFYTAEDTVSYTVKVYLNFDGVALDSLVHLQSGDFITSGFHTVPLDSIIALDSSTDLYIYVEFDRGGHAIDITSVVPVLLGASSRTLVPSSAQLDESYYLENGIWQDLYNYPFVQYSQTANFCIKALTTDTSFIIPPPPNSINGERLIENFNLYPNPTNRGISLEAEVGQSQTSIIEVFSINCQLLLSHEWVMKTGLNKLSLDEVEGFSEGVYILQLQSNDTRIHQKFVKQ